MIYFCSEFWMHSKHGIIAGVCYPDRVEIYHVVGYKKVRLSRICRWEEENQKTYPRLSFRIAKSLKTIKNWGWIKSEGKENLIHSKYYEKILHKRP